MEIDKESGVLQYKSGEPYFIHANGFGYLDIVISKLGYTIQNDDIKNELFYNVIEQKIWHYTKDFFKKFHNDNIHNIISNNIYHSLGLYQ